MKKGGINKVILKIENKFWLIMSLLFILFASSIVLAGNPQIFGHDSSEINGLTWNGNVGQLVYSDVPIQGGHSSSELKDVVWFNENGQKVGAILRNGSFSSCSYTFLISSSGQTSYTGTILSHVNNSNYSQIISAFIVQDTTKTIIYFSGWLPYPQKIMENGQPKNNIGYQVSTSSKKYLVLFEWENNYVSFIPTSKGVAFMAYLYDVTSFQPLNGAQRSQWPILINYKCSSYWM